jgi:Protein of unknown function (DUF2911)
MRRFSLALAVVAALASSALYAQQMTTIHPSKGGSPHVKSAWTAHGAHIAIEYGRPYLKGRAESTMMPAGMPWRTGADEATTITTDKTLKFGTLTLAPGTYTINTQPGAMAWELVVGKLGKPGQWGIPYDASLEMGRAPMKLGKAGAPAEQLTISIDDAPDGGVLRIEWGTVSATATFTVA